MSELDYPIGNFRCPVSSLYDLAAWLGPGVHIWVVLGSNPKFGVLGGECLSISSKPSKKIYT